MALTMTATSADPAAPNPPEATPTGKKARQEDSLPVFLIKLVVIVFIFRSFIFSPFNIPSESMLPRLWDGDYLLASKWSYGYSAYSLPFGIVPPGGRVFASQPERGDVVIFKAPPTQEEDYIKRVIGLPGDQIQMIGGVLHLNGVAVRKVRLADFEIPVSPNTDCAAPQFAATGAQGQEVCRYPRFTETLPGGKSYQVLDFGDGQADDTPVTVVPEGMLFLMGDNRDNSMDSRFPAVVGGGIGLVPQDNLVGKAQIMMWSTDGSANWFLPWTWFTAARWDRIGRTF